jgi:alpha-L-fucosidase 2
MYKSLNSTIILVILASFVSACSLGLEESKYKLWYEKPAADWMTEALPIGNGEIGAIRRPRFQS